MSRKNLDFKLLGKPPKFLKRRGIVQRLGQRSLKAFMLVRVQLPLPVRLRCLRLHASLPSWMTGFEPLQTLQNLIMKNCSKCKVLKSLEEFAVAKTKADGRTPDCKECKRAYNKNYYSENYDAERIRLKRRQNEQRQVLEQYFREVKTKCSRCGEGRFAALDFHHKDPSTKEITLSEAFNRIWSLEKVKKEVNKCEVICSNCHRVEHSKQ